MRAGEGKSVPTASNAAYGVVSHDLQSGGGEGDVAMYEVVGQPPSATPTAHPPSDPAYAVIAGQWPINATDVYCKLYNVA